MKQAPVRRPAKLYMFVVFLALGLQWNGRNAKDPGAAGLLGTDGSHPNDDGHNVIADQLRALGYAPLH